MRQYKDFKYWKDYENPQIIEEYSYADLTPYKVLSFLLFLKINIYNYQKKKNKAMNSDPEY